MATRILVRCKTAEMPGSTHERHSLMADMVCQRVWNRPFDKDCDRLTTYGGYTNSTCVLLIDYGPVDAEDYVVIHLSWKASQFVEVTGPIAKYIQSLLETAYHFNPGKRPVPVRYNDEELKEKIGPEKFEKFVTDRAEQMARLET